MPAIDRSCLACDDDGRVWTFICDLYLIDFMKYPIGNQSFRI